MLRYSELDGQERTCLNCLFSEWDSGDESTGMPGYIFCEKDEDGLLDVDAENGAIAKLCPFFREEQTQENESAIKTTLDMLE